MSLESDLKKYEKLVNTVKKTGEEAQTLMEDIKTRIKTGKYTTGDKIKNFVICTNGLPNEDFEAAYRRLEKRIEGRKGEQILFVEETEREDDIIKYCMDPGRREGFMPGPKRMKKTEVLKLGVLLEDHLSFDLEKSKFAFPVGKYAAQFDKGRDPWKLVEEDISFHAYEIIQFDGKLYELSRKNNPFSFLTRTSRSERLFIYLDKEVEKYFSEPRMDLSYIGALTLLGREVPKKFWDAYKLQEEKEKTALVKEIEELVSAKLSTDDDEKKSPY